MSEAMSRPTISPVPGRVRWPPWSLERLHMMSYFEAYLAPKVAKCLNTIFILSSYKDVLKSDYPYISDTQQQIRDAEREISHLENNCIEKLKLSLLTVSIAVNDYEITNGLIHIYGNTRIKDSNVLKLAVDWQCDREIIMRLIRAGQNLNCVLGDKGDYVLTPLYYACWLNDYDMVELLLRHGARLVPEEKYGVIVAAALCSDVHIMRLLLSHLTYTQRTLALKPIQKDIGYTGPLTSAILFSNWESFKVLVKSVRHSSLNEHQPSAIDTIALNIITKIVKSHEQTEWLNKICDYINWDLKMFQIEIYNGLYGKDSLLLLAIEHNNDPVVECIVRNHLHRLDTLSLQTALEAAVHSRCQADVINNILECLPESDRCDAQMIKQLYRSTGTLREEHGYTALHVASDLGITTHFRALLHKYGARALFEDNHGTVMSPLSLAAKHPCLWSVFTETSISRKMDNSGFNLTKLAHTYNMFPSTDILCIPSIDFSESQQTWVNTEQVHVTQNFSQVLNKYQIMPVWDSKSGETNQITSTVIDYLSKVSSLMQENFPFLAFDVRLSGSSKENTKAIAPDELDFILPLTVLSEFITVQNTSATAPYVSVASYTSLREMLNKHKLLNEQDILQMADLFYLFRTEFRRCISMLKPPRKMCIYNNVLRSCIRIDSYSPFELKLQWLGDIYKNINIKVDIVPAVVMMDINKLSIPTHVQNKIEKNNLSESNVYAVLKKDIFYPNHLRLSFSEHEAALIKQASEEARKGYTLAKCLRDSKICPKVQLPYSSEYMEAEQSVSTYVLKTCFIALLKEREAAADAAKEESTAEDTDPIEHIISFRSITWAKMIYKKLEENLTRHGKVPHIFYEDWDVYHGEYQRKNSINAPRHQMLADRKMGVTLLHCKVITNMLNTLHEDLQFRATANKKDIPLRQSRWGNSLLSGCMFFLYYCLLLYIWCYYGNIFTDIYYLLCYLIHTFAVTLYRFLHDLAIIIVFLTTLGVIMKIPLHYKKHKNRLDYKELFSDLLVVCIALLFCCLFGYLGFYYEMIFRDGYYLFTDSYYLSTDSYYVFTYRYYVVTYSYYLFCYLIHKLAVSIVLLSTLCVMIDYRRFLVGCILFVIVVYCIIVYIGFYDENIFTDIDYLFTDSYYMLCYLIHKFAVKLIIGLHVLPIIVFVGVIMDYRELLSHLLVIVVYFMIGCIVIAITYTVTEYLLVIFFSIYVIMVLYLVGYSIHQFYLDLKEKISPLIPQITTEALL